MSDAVAEYELLSTVEDIFNLEELDNFDKTTFLGPWSTNTTIDIQIVGVPPYGMGMSDSSRYLEIMSEFLEGMETDLKYPIDVSCEKLDYQMLREEQLYNTHILFTRVKFITLLASSPPEPSIEYYASNYIEAHGKLFARMLSESDSQYFDSVSAARNKLTDVELKNLLAIQSEYETELRGASNHHESNMAMIKDVTDLSSSTILSLIFGPSVVLVLVVVIVLIVLNRKEKERYKVYNFDEEENEGRIIPANQKQKINNRTVSQIAVV